MKTSQEYINNIFLYRSLRRFRMLSPSLQSCIVLSQGRRCILAQSFHTRQKNSYVHTELWRCFFINVSWGNASWGKGSSLSIKFELLDFGVDSPPNIRGRESFSSKLMMMGVYELLIIWRQHHECSLGKNILYISPKSPPKEGLSSPKPCRNNGSETA